MRNIEGINELKVLFRDYRSMDKDDLDDFYKSKCDYYQRYVGLCLVAGSVLSIGYLWTDFLLNGSAIPTLIPRLSILIFLLIFGVVTNFLKGRTATVVMDFFLGHAIAITTIWAIFFLKDRTHSCEGFIIINLIWMVIGFVSTPKELTISTVIFILEILISHSFNHYQNLDIILALVIPCAVMIILSHVILTLFYLDHYRVQQKLELAMITDPLTQVYNRHLLEKIVSKNALKDAVEGEPIAVAMLDIDYFKKINDEHGHYTGDLTLLFIGQKLQNETHENDYVIRYGGEEFVIIFKNCDVNNACARMEQFRRDIEKAKDTPVQFTISAGVSRYTGDFSKTIQNVDAALYKAKNTGRNKVVVF